MRQAGNRSRAELAPALWHTGLVPFPRIALPAALLGLAVVAAACGDSSGRVDGSPAAEPGPGGGGQEGEPCPPCQAGLACVPHGTISFCRKPCTGVADCFGFKELCLALMTGGQTYCVPHTGDVEQGQPCATPTLFCKAGLLCDPKTGTCLLPCAPSSGCPPPATCSKLVDNRGVVLGYGCR